LLAYVFWHWPKQGLDIRSYERDLTEFQRRLHSVRPSGFRGAAVFRSAPAPGVGAPRPCYTDWYLLDNSAALDPLDECAVAPPCREAHDRVARAASGGAGALYRLRAGVPSFATARYASWLSKPAGMSYGEFYGRTGMATADASAVLWGRQMVLGPAPEFCLMSPQPLDLPGEFRVVRVELEPVYTAAAALEGGGMTNGE